MLLAIWRATVSMREVCLASHVAAELAPPTAMPVSTSGQDPLLSRAACTRNTLSAMYSQLQYADTSMHQPCVHSAIMHPCIGHHCVA